MNIKWSNDIIQRKTKQPARSSKALVTINRQNILVNGTAHSLLANAPYLAIGVDENDHLVVANTDQAKTYVVRCLDLDRYAFGPQSICAYLLDTYTIQPREAIECISQVTDDEILLVSVDPLPRRYKEDD